MTALPRWSCCVVVIVDDQFVGGVGIVALGANVVGDVRATFAPKATKPTATSTSATLAHTMTRRIQPPVSIPVTPKHSYGFRWLPAVTDRSLIYGHLSHA